MIQKLTAGNALIIVGQKPLKNPLIPYNLYISLAALLAVILINSIIYQYNNNNNTINIILYYNL